jgi:predicted enzyme related to lactoylglutathione lyase
MRDAILAMTLALTVLTGPLHAAAHKKPPADVGVGRVAWFDITTTNLAKSKDFYAKLFDWQFKAVAGTDQAEEIAVRGTGIGTLRVTDGAISGFNGVVYVQVADVQASSGKAKELGAMVVPGFPFNLPDGTGAISLVVDPSGHPVGMYSRKLLPSMPAKAK